MMIRLIIIFISTLVISTHLSATEIIELWPKSTLPNYQQAKETEQIINKDIIFIKNIQTPSLEILLPSKRSANGMAILILPGGGYSGVAYDWEGTDYAKWLNSLGIAAFVLKYRMPQAQSVITSYKAPIQDAQRAMRYIRFNATQFNIDTNKVGVIGSSAGGHLASTLGTHQKNYYPAQDAIDNEHTLPNFMMLIYPVISMKKGITHDGSRNKLLGKEPANELIDQFSNETRVTKKTPPTFLIHSGNDKTVPVENSLLIYRALVRHNVKTTMHIYPKGGHGYGLGISNNDAPDWTQHGELWLEAL